MAKYEKLAPKKRLVKMLGILPNIRVISQQTADRYVRRFGGEYTTQTLAGAPFKVETFKVLVRPTGKWAYIA